MSARTRNCYRSDAEFDAAVRLLNALTDSWRQFQPTKANKDHSDEFRDQITRGDIYFKRETGTGFGEGVKLSEKSMEALCCCLFFDNRQLTAIAEKLADQREKELEESMARVSRLVAEE